MPEASRPSPSHLPHPAEMPEMTNGGSVWYPRYPWREDDKQSPRKLTLIVYQPSDCPAANEARDSPSPSWTIPFPSWNCGSFDVYIVRRTVVRARERLKRRITGLTVRSGAEKKIRREREEEEKRKDVRAPISKYQRGISPAAQWAIIGSFALAPASVGRRNDLPSCTCLSAFPFNYRLQPLPLRYLPVQTNDTHANYALNSVEL